MEKVTKATTAVVDRGETEAKDETPMVGTNVGTTTRILCRIRRIPTTESPTQDPGLMMKCGPR
jgi:hypothetical protein